METVWTEILMVAGLAGVVAKVAVDLLRQAYDLPRWAPPMVAALVGVGVAFLLSVAAGVPITAQRAALDLLAGMLAGGIAVGVTEVGRRADNYYSPPSPDPEVDSGGGR